ncbi:MAG: bifunctional riboflavin kinase/FAD synthetase [Thiomicrospira sp.]|uniref:bifunctional riboflavin kinase/FAD synthetase n=1 Tax=Thiomicrospira sp. TaxID=935 RepID=UPI0019E6C2F0|nr:bifunctional riboflavin kinase/FAD synthetase [Thiomicrospira sp.]MBE0494552.1 bifunctional riboflavin kinase/FAD synthetase [Thiomicrospira sp.]
MRLIRGLHNLANAQSALRQGSVVTIGNFDGVHIGHQRVLDELKQCASQAKLPSVVMIFEPFPVEFFRPEDAPVRLMNLREKLHAFERTGVDFVLCVAFNAEFANLSAQQFVIRVLQQGLKVRHLVVGDDFRFGHQRQGDFKFLKAQGKELGFDVSAMSTFIVDAERVSSTRIREVLQIPDLAQANYLLGHDFRFEGRVIHGQKLGRKIGFPTLNLNPKRIQMPVSGVFAVKVAGLAEQAWPGVANIGVRPTVQGKQPSIEVHLFDWQTSVYGAHVEVRLEAFIRPEMKFNGLSELQTQIAKDAAQARQLLNLKPV